jgi:hypothetical protein
MELATHLRQQGDRRTPDEIVVLAVRNWLAAQRPAARPRGYQWKELFLPEGTELRLRYMGMYYYATVDGDRILHGEQAVSPREWLLSVTGTVRNAWRDIWLRRYPGECWTRAGDWRSSNSVVAPLPYCDRRRRTRRSAD